MIDRSRAVTPPPGRGVVRIACPGQHCFDTGRPKWICPSCRDVVSYGFTDAHMYCRCSRYPASHAVFKCRHNQHGSDYAKHTPDHLRSLLAALDPVDEYNMLILGRTGTGKSMFINAFHNYVYFKTLKEAMANEGCIRYVIPFSFTREEENGEVYEVVVGDETEFETFSRTGQSGTRQSMVYSFTLDGKIFNLIDTPGIGDTRGPIQDHRNMNDILSVLEKVDKLSAVLFLLPPDETRLDSSFEFCITLLLSHLHRDIVKNVFFIFNRASSTNYRAGATRIQLDNLLRGLNTGLSRNETNQFFFDSEGYMFLAAYKQKQPREWANRDRYSKMWEISADETYRLLTAAMQLPTHQVRKTLSVNRIRRVLEGMAKPLTQFASSMEHMQLNLEAVRQKLTDLGAEGNDLTRLAEELKSDMSVPVRYELPSKRTVCTEKDCLQSKKVCHDGCSIDAPDEIFGSPALYYCSAFRRWWSAWLLGGHPWDLHMLVSYEFREEARTIEDAETSNKIKLNKDKKVVVQNLIQHATRCRDEVAREWNLVNKKRAEFGIYLVKNSLVGKNDAYAKHLDVCIEVARLANRTTEVDELHRQKTAYMDMKKHLWDAAIAEPSTVLDEDGLEKAIQDLKNMRMFGQALSKAFDPVNAVPKGERFKQICEEPGTKPGMLSRFHWPW
ncbi:hypothetical protein B0T14DRAFT_527632 [Immersiella caudata]|uniref:DUF8206 domain-containing protein n=1 Tax=Immersiella caudata TaxID=314043 RepID=A0AA40BUH3_9PEZI|nr:hypothetical protein B0T14DRAFT_527632 [Immersiella caudata]